MSESRKLPIGIHDFEKVRSENYLYVDKSLFVYKMAKTGSFYFLTRPRFFGKTMLLSAVEAYFRGRRDLFEGLAISALEDEWQEYPVFTLDFSTDVYTQEGRLEDFLEAFLSEQETRYGKHQERRSFSSRFEHIIRRAYEISGKPVVILIDNYDKPILDAIFTPEENHNRDVLREFYSVLNGNDFYLKFVLMCGITKFASVNIFNGSNQAKDISFHKDFANICGFTQDEIQENFAPELEAFAADFSVSPQTILKDVSDRYGGYNFVRQTDNFQKLYNPFSLLNALDSREFGSYWFQTGLPAMLIKMLQASRYDLFNIILGLSVDFESLSDYRWTEDDLITLIYQCGYLTLQNSDAKNNLCHLGLPNAEVRQGFLKGVLSFYTNIGTASRLGTEISQFTEQLKAGELALFFEHFSSIIKDIPAVKKKKETPEQIFLVAFHSILQLTGFEVLQPNSSLDIRNDIILQTDTDIYVFILKADKGFPVEDVLADALARIDEKKYTARYKDMGKTIHKVALVFNATTLGISDWKEIF